MNANIKITRNTLSLMGGICFVLFALVTLFSANTPFAFLFELISQSFGFVGFWILLPYIVIVGLSLMINRKFFKFHLKTSLWGVFIIIFSFLIISSHWGTIGTNFNGVTITGKSHGPGSGSQFLTVTNFKDLFYTVKDANPTVLGPHIKLGGGTVGFLIAGAINSAITPVGLTTVCWLLIILGLLLIFNKQVKEFVSYLIEQHKKVKENEQFKEVSLEMEQSVPTPTIKIEESPKQEEPVYSTKAVFESFHTTQPIRNDHDLRKARYSFGDEEEEPKFEDKSEEEMSKATFDFNQNEEIEEPFYEEPKTPTIDEEVEEEPPHTSLEVKPTIMPVVQESIHEKVIPEEPKIEEVHEEEVAFVNRPQPKAKLTKNYIYPSLDLLDKPVISDAAKDNESSCLERVEIINTAFKNLRIGAEVVSYIVGPTVTRYDIKTNDDVSVTGIQRYISDLAIRLGGESVRFEPIVPGKPTSGLEIPNKVRSNVSLREALEELYKNNDPKFNYYIPFGKSISGELKAANLIDFPHLLVAGTTGSGKSIFVHATIISLLMRNTPEELKLVMIDPKRVEMSYYEDIPHLLCPVICDVKKAYVCLMKLVDEMERRYNLFQSNRVRDIKGFNQFAKQNGIQPLPHIVVFIDEYADLIETVKEVRDPVVRIVQKARAAGIHMVFATQRPSVDIIDGVIKANVSARVALMCASPTDSVCVIGEGGAEDLLGNGDMLIDCSLLSRTMKTRVQGCYVSEVEIKRICDFLREHYPTQFEKEFLNLEPAPKEPARVEPEVAPIDKGKTDDEVYQRIKEDATHREYFSISHITRTYGMGFSRAGKMFARLIQDGIVESSGDARGCKVKVYNPVASQVTTSEQSTFIPDDGSDDEDDN